MEIRFSDLDFLNLTDYQALCRGTRSVFPEVRAELYAAKECRVLYARRWKRPERITGLKCEAALWTFRAICRKSQSRERQHLILLDNVSWVCASTKGRSSIWSVDLRPRKLCASALPLMPVFVIGESRQSVIQQMSRHADSSIHRNTMRASVRLQTRDCPDNVCFWMSSTHRVLAATLCNESKRRRKLRALLGPAAAEAAREQQRAASRTVKASALPPGFAFDEHWRSAPSPTTSKPRFLQPSRTSMLGRPPGLIHGTSRRWLLRQSPQKHRPRSLRLFACSLVGWPTRHYLGLGSDTGRVPGVELRPRHNTGHGQQDARSGVVGASESPATHVTKCPLGHRLLPALGILPSISDQGTAAAGGSLTCRTSSKTFGSLLLPALRNVHAVIGRNDAARLPAPSINQRHF